jgi:hypothetical protein
MVVSVCITLGKFCKLNLQPTQHLDYYVLALKRQSHYRLGQSLMGARRLRLPDFKTIGT